MSNQSSFNLNVPSEQLLLISILNTMYNDNLRQINSLNASNNEIRNIITNLLNPRSQTTNRVRNRHHNYRDSFTRNSNVNSNLNSNLNRIYIDNLPYIIEDVQEFRIPQSQLNDWIGNPEAHDFSQRGTDSNQRRTQMRTSNFTSAFQRFLEPVDVFPTQTQIESATRRARYCDIVSPINRSCPISLENFNDTDIVSVIRYCGHVFHTEDLNIWFRTNCRCPVCRYDIRNYNSNSSHIQPQTQTNPSTPTTPSTPLNEAENSSSSLNEERNTRNSSNNSTMPSYINTLFNSIINDVNSQDIENVSNIFTDSSGNLTTDVSDPVILFRLLSTINNRSQR